MLVKFCSNLRRKLGIFHFIPQFTTVLSIFLCVLLLSFPGVESRIVFFFLYVNQHCVWCKLTGVSTNVTAIVAVFSYETLTQHS